MAQDVTLDMLQVLIQRCVDEQATTRRENLEMRSLMLATVEQGRRIERRLGEVTDDLELMVKAERMGRLGHFELQIDSRLEAIEQRLPAV